MGIVRLFGFFDRYKITIFLALAFPLFVALFENCCSHSIADEAGAMEKKKNSFSLNDFGNGDMAHTFHLNPMRQGEEAHATVVLRNLSNRPVTTRSSKVGCACTTAKVQKITLMPGEIGTFAFSFSLAKRPRKHSYESFMVDILTEEDVVTYHLSFRAEVIDFVSFGTSQFFGVLPLVGEKFRFELPLHTSMDTQLDDLRVEASDEMKMLGFQFRINDDVKEKRYFVSCEGSLKNSVGSEVFSQVQVFHKRQSEPESLAFTLRNRPSMEILPSKLMFSRAVSEDEESPSKASWLSAIALLRVMKISPEATVEVKASASDGRRLDCSAQKIRDGVYRLRLLLEPSSEEKSAPKKLNVVWAITVGGKSHELISSLGISN